MHNIFSSRKSCLEPQSLTSRQQTLHHGTFHSTLLPAVSFLNIVMLLSSPDFPLISSVNIQYSVYPPCSIHIRCVAFRPARRATVAFAVSLRLDRRLFPLSCYSWRPRQGWTRLCACPLLCVWDYFFRVPSQNGRSGLRLAHIFYVFMARTALLFTPVTPVRKVNRQAWGCGCQLTPQHG